MRSGFKAATRGSCCEPGLGFSLQHLGPTSKMDAKSINRWDFFSCPERRAFEKNKKPTRWNMKQKWRQREQFIRECRVSESTVQTADARQPWRPAASRCWRGCRRSEATAGISRPPTARHGPSICEGHSQSWPWARWGFWVWFYWGLCRGRCHTGRMDRWKTLTWTPGRSGAPGRWSPYSAGVHRLLKYTDQYT